MSSSDFVDYEVALMLAKYGKGTLLRALAQKLQMTPEQLEIILQTPPRQKSASRVKTNPSSAVLVKELARAHPAKAHLLETLHDRFVNRTFLPDLRDVRRFFERHGHPWGAAKSRASSVEKVVRLLADLGTDELEALCQPQPEGGYSSLALISDAILHRER